MDGQRIDYVSARGIVARSCGYSRTGSARARTRCNSGRHAGREAQFVGTRWKAGAHRARATRRPGRARSSIRVRGSVEPDLLTTARPPAFEPKVSDAELFERPTLPSRIFEIPLEAAEPVRASAAQLGELVSEPAPVTAAPASIAALAQTGNGAMQSPEMLEAIVSRIVERMQPQVIDVVTREILRPLVEALVRREIDKH